MVQLEPLSLSDNRLKYSFISEQYTCKYIGW